METDAEKQPLLRPTEVRYRRYRPLTYEEILNTRQEVTWRRARFGLVLMFWAIMAMLLSLIACILIKTSDCDPYDVELKQVPSVPPVHMTFAPLVSRMSESQGTTEDQKTGVYEFLS